MTQPSVAAGPVALTWRGAVAGIYIAADGAGPIESLQEIEAVAGQGLKGDRYFAAKGTYSATPGVGRQLTLIEQEALDAAASKYGISLEPGQSRRNIETVGVPLNHLVGKEFMIGSVRVRGLSLNEPCGHLAKLSNPGVIKALTHRGGLRADILEGGVIRVGDAIQPVDPRP